MLPGALEVAFDRLTNVLSGFGTCVPLGNAARQGGATRDKHPILVLFKVHAILHPSAFYQSRDALNFSRIDPGMVNRIAIALLVVITVSHAQESSTALSNPFTSPADVADGERVYLSQCASCHGREGRGTSAGPDVSTGNFRRASSDEGLLQVINKGVPGTTMPAFSMNSRQAWQIVAFLRSLAANRAKQTSPGDPAIGARIYQANGCAGCHTTTAPELFGIVARRTLNELRESILDSQADVPSQYWRLRITKNDGGNLSGDLLNEDTFSIQFRDAGGNLRSVRRADVRKIEYDRTSPMPSFRQKLSDTDLNHLLAFLISRGAR